jgi:sigma-54 dependent transcriptional regulator, acetoin dehydrogenase operon transcriptional activator AcoR
MFKVLFICTGTSGRSHMAVQFAKNYSPNYAEILCASDKYRKVNKNAIKVMSEINEEIPDHIQVTIDEVKSDQYDIVVTLCNHALEICPIFPGSPARIHWALDDPATDSPEADEIDRFRSIRNEIQQRVKALFSYGFVESFREIRFTLASLLNHLTDGVIAHDMDRRIFFINKAAEQITGFKRADVIGRDCHKTFPGRFCGGDCSFCDEKDFSDSRIRYSRMYKRPSGERRDLEMSVVTIAPPNHKVIGALVIFRDITEVMHLRRRLDDSRGFHGIIGHHATMEKVFDSINELADVQVPILIQGETGTGKEMVANALHQYSSNPEGPFVPINCGALPEGTLESELFGHVKGAFTGAISNRKGRFELAEGGTIFLDEIGEISHNMQVKLLRVLQEKCFVPVGGEKTVKVNARVICATNRDLKQSTKQGLFREDLYYRLAVVPINMPPLRDRKSDIKLLIEHFLDKYSQDIGKRVVDISQDALDTLVNYNWPGNVRELSNAVQYSMIKSQGGGTLEKEQLPPEILDYSVHHKPTKPGRPQKVNSEIIEDALQKSGGNKAKAAKLLGISRTTLYRLIK